MTARRAEIAPSPNPPSALTSCSRDNATLRLRRPQPIEPQVVAAELRREQT
jgi:hypothetical protein